MVNRGEATKSPLKEPLPASVQAYYSNVSSSVPTVDAERERRKDEERTLLVDKKTVGAHHRNKYKVTSEQGRGMLPSKARTQTGEYRGEHGDLGGS